MTTDVLDQWGKGGAAGTGRYIPAAVARSGHSSPAARSAPARAGDRSTLHPVRSSHAGTLRSAACRRPPLPSILSVGCCQHPAEGTVVPWIPPPRPGQLHLEMSGDKATSNDARTSAHTRRQHLKQRKEAHSLRYISTAGTDAFAAPLHARCPSQSCPSYVRRPAHGALKVWST